MTDKNGIEIKSGDIVEIKGAYFKRDNGLYFVAHAPGDPGWFGKGYSLKKISKTGKISKAKYNLCFWPIMICLNDRAKAAEAGRWNAENATIEIASAKSAAEVAEHFRAEADATEERLKWVVRNFGETLEAATLRGIKAHYEAVVEYVTN